MKVGTFVQTGKSRFWFERGPADVGGLPVAYRFNGNVPNRLTQYAGFSAEG